MLLLSGRNRPLLAKNIAIPAIGWNTIRRVQKAIALGAKIHKRRLQRWFDIDDAAFIDISRLLPTAFAFQENLSQLAVF